MAPWTPQLSPTEPGMIRAQHLLAEHDITDVSPWRVNCVNDIDRIPADASCVVYLMRRTQRGVDNPALNVAIAIANARSVPLVVLFKLGAGPTGNNERHVDFMLRGMPEAARQVVDRGAVYALAPWQTAPAAVLIRSLQPGLVVTDDDVMPGAVRSRAAIGRAIAVPMLHVDNDVVIPGARFDRCEYAARTIRPRVHMMLAEHLAELAPRTAEPMVRVQAPATLVEHLQLEGCVVATHSRPVVDVQFLELIPDAPVTHSAHALPQVPSGPVAAHAQLDHFLQHGLDGYSDRRNHPDVEGTSRLSHFLHFGHIAAARVVHAARAHADAGGCSSEDIASFVEELVVRRELAHNYVRFNPQAHSLAGAPAWARATLAAHAADPREWVYSLEDLTEASTHDPLWNAAQKQMMKTGLMHGYVRMYWAKKILEWSPDPDTAFAHALTLNDTWHLDGRDPNGIVGVAWAIAGVHDRPWTERPIFGTIRFMSLASTGRKFNSKAYIARWGGEASRLFS
jgi:deoxyribodipyrimidine photo-lyase